jgi:hypothetical protein
MRLGEKLVNLCIIGNSHVAALKKAWDVIRAEYPSIKVTFFARRGNELNNLVVTNGKLQSPNEAGAKELEFVSGGRRRIDPDKYDVFLVYGCYARATFRNSEPFYSRAVQDRAAHDLVDGSLSFKLLTSLRTITNKPVLVGHNPLEAAKSNELAHGPDAYVAGIKMLNDLIYRPLGAEILMQPLETIVNGCATRLEFSKGSRRLAIGDQFDDDTYPDTGNDHMNEEFGKMWLVELFKKLPLKREPHFVRRRVATK